MAKKNERVDITYTGEKTDIMNSTVGVVPKKGKSYNVPMSEWEAASEDYWKLTKKSSSKKKVTKSKGV